MSNGSTNIVGLPYFYDNSIRKLILQFMRCLSGFKVKNGVDSSGFDSYTTVPVVYGDPSRQAEQILRLNSENSVQSYPKIAVYISNMRNAHLRRGSYPGLTREMVATERYFDQTNGTYTDQPGLKYQVELINPIALDIDFNVDVWTTNTDQKLQILEQLLTVFAPSIDIFTSNSTFDWTSLKIIKMNEDIIFDNVGVPKNDNDNTTTLTLSFSCEAWVNPPARVTRNELINTIIERLNIADSIINDTPQNEVLLGYKITTPGNFLIAVNGSSVTLLNSSGGTTNKEGGLLSWNLLIDQYGELSVNYSKLALNTSTDPTSTSSFIFGYISYGTASNILNFQAIANSIPNQTLASVNQFVDPHTLSPSAGLPPASNGQRYILTANIGGTNLNWGALTANTGDIIQYIGTAWIDVFSAGTTSTEFVLDDSSNILYQLVSHNWIPAINGTYQAGFWQLML